MLTIPYIPFLHGHIEEKKPDNQADSDKEFIELVGKVIQSPYVVSVAQSLIARANEVRDAKAAAVTASSASDKADDVEENSDDV